MKIFYTLDKDALSAIFWAENAPENKVSVKGRWQTYSGDRATKNNTRIIFSNLPAFCDPQKTITLDPNQTTGEFVPKLNTKTNTGATTRKIFDYVKAVDLAEYLDNENDKQTFQTLLDKAKQVFDRKQAEANKVGIQNHLAGLAKLGISGTALIELLQQQYNATTGGENE